MDSIRGKCSGFSSGAWVIKAQVKTLPSGPGVYRMLSGSGQVLYVGKARNLKKRVAVYTCRERLPRRLQRMVARTRGMEIVVTRTEAEALLLEASLIRRFAPPFNIMFRDDKSYPYIVITRGHEFPQLLKHRGARTRGGLYFGPFASAAAVNETLALLQRAFMLRNCSDSFFAARRRPCLQYHVKRCTAPCADKVDKLGYARQVEEAIDFLRGRSVEVQKKLAAEMRQASAELDYERAAVLRDRIRALTSIQARQDVHKAGLGDADVIALHQAGGHVVIQIFFYRADRNYGTRAFFLRHGENEGAGIQVGRGFPYSGIMASFLAQFYAGKPAPKTIISSHMPSDARILAEALTEQAGHKVKIIAPKLGEKKRLVDLALHNAREALGRKMAEGEEQEKLMRRLAALLGLAAPPRRIEVYDNSHIQGGFPVGAMIAAGPDGFLKKTYRKFNIREAHASSDTGMVREVLTRRFRRLLEEDPRRESGMWPDLLLIDGGQGQLNAACGILRELGVQGVAVAAIAKGPDRNAGRERVFLPGKAPLMLSADDPALYYLQRLRDEAHRFAAGSHRARRKKSIGENSLDAIEGVGAARKRALLHHFGSAKAVSEAREEEIRRTPGISAALAKRIYGHFRIQDL